MKKFFLLLVAFVLVACTSFAQAFSDVPAGYWAEKVINEMVEAKIIAGYSDGTFHPKENLKKIHALIFIARVSGANKNVTAVKTYTEKYADLLAKYSTQYKSDVSYLLGTGILKEADLATFVADDVANSDITREEMAILVTKALGKEEEAVSKSIIILSFADTSSISSKAKPYVYYVSSQGYMTGDTATTFSPKSPLNRAQAAATLQRIYKKVPVIDDLPIETSQPITPTTKPVTSFLSGTITKIDTAAGSVWIKDKDNNTEEYEYDSKTEFYVGTTKKTYESMAKDATVSITVSNGEYITIMNISSGATSTTSTVSGKISAYNISKKTIAVLDGSKASTYTYTSSTKFTLDGKSSTYSKAIAKNREVTLTVDDNSIISTAKITVPEDTITGKITSVSKSEGYIVIEDDDDEKYILMDEYLDEYEDDDEDYYFDDDTDFYYNGSGYSYSKISSTSYLYKKGYYIKITLKDDYIEELEVNSKSSSFDDSSSEQITGKITTADDDEYYIIITDDEDDDYILMDDSEDEYSDGDEDYYYDEDTDFYYNGSSISYSKASSTSYLYKKGYYIRLTLDDDDYIERLEIASKESNLDSSNEEITGEITSVSKSEGYVAFEDDDGDEYILMDDYLDEYEDDDEDYYFDDDTDFYYNGSSYSYSKISSTSYLYKKGNYIRITLDDDDYIETLEVGSTESKLDSSDSSSSSSISDGFIYGTILDFDDDYIDIEDSDGEEYSFVIGSDCVIIEKSSSDPSDDYYYYDDDYDDVLDYDDDVVVFTYKKSSSKYYTSLIILLD